MVRKRITALLMTLALTLAGASVALAEDVDFDPTSEPAFNRNEAIILFHAFKERLVAMGLEEGEILPAISYLSGTLADLTPAQVDELLIASGLAESDAEMGDEEFGAEEGEEPADEEEE